VISLLSTGKALSTCLSDYDLHSRLSDHTTEAGLVTDLLVVDGGGASDDAAEAGLVADLLVIDRLGGVGDNAAETGLVADLLLVAGGGRKGGSDGVHCKWLSGWALLRSERL
jgi:hypothetical protein